MLASASVVNMIAETPKTQNHNLYTHLTLMLAFASAENMVALTPLRLAICCPTAARMQQSATCSTWWMRPDRSASANLRHSRVLTK